MIRVLFADDHSQVLTRQRQVLRSYRQDWTMEFCLGSQQALETLATDPFDVVVAGADMNGIQGGQLLDIVSDLYPQSIRIAMGSQADYERMFKAVHSAHQFLSSTCSPESLYQAIQRAVQLAGRLGNPRLQKLAGQLDSLPSLPSIYLKLVEELRNQNASVERIGALISQDLSMTAKVLQLVNSSFFSLPVHVSSASHAAALLGLNMLRPLVLSAGIFRQLENSGVPPSMLERTLNHSMAVSCLARRLAESATDHQETIDNAMIAGVLHDIGKLVLADNFCDEYQALCQTAKDLQLPLRVAEVERYGATHASVGGYLLGLWGLPQDIVEAVAYHHDPSASTNEAISPLTFVHTANVLLLLADADSASAPSAEMDMVYLKKLGLTGRLEEWKNVMCDV